MRISDWSSDVCSSDLIERLVLLRPQVGRNRLPPLLGVVEHRIDVIDDAAEREQAMPDDIADTEFRLAALRHGDRSALVRNWTRGGIGIRVGWPLSRWRDRR